MPIDRDRYPDDWDAISRSIRFGRAGGRCECVGECGGSHSTPCAAPHGAPVYRIPGRATAGWWLPSVPGERPPVGYVQGHPVALTCAHVDQDPANNDSANLRAWCPACHIAHDRAFRDGVHERRRRQLRLWCPNCNEPLSEPFCGGCGWQAE